MSKSIRGGIAFSIIVVTMHLLLIGQRISQQSAPAGIDSPSAVSSASLYKAPVTSITDPRIFSVIVIFAILAASAALNSGVAALILRKRLAEQNAILATKVFQLQTLEARQNAVLSALPDLIFTFDEKARYKGYIKSGNNLAIDPETIIGKTMGEIFGDDELHGRLLMAIRAVLDDKPPQLFEYSLPTMPGRRFEARVVKLSNDSALSICRNITERHKAEEQRNASLLEKEALLREIHHRVKNNMQIISSLLSIQSSKARDEYDKELFNDSQGRIRAMAAVHDQLYRSTDFTSIQASEYISDLASELALAWSRPERSISVSIDTDGISLELDYAVPIGLIINELMTNSFKYAFGDNDTGQIAVRLKRIDGGRIAISVSDDGVGFPEGFDASNEDDGMGFTIVNALVTQIRGSLETSDSEAGGAEVRIVCPISVEAVPER